MRRTIAAVAIAATALAPATQAWARDTDPGALQRAEDAPDLLELDPETDSVGLPPSGLPETDTVEAPGHGAIVRAVARCAPRGRDVRDVLTNMRNHGAFVTVAAQGGTIDIEVPLVTSDGAEVVGTQSLTADLSTLEGAGVLCQATESIQRAADLHRALEAAGTRRHGPPDRKSKPDHAGPPDHARTGKPDHTPGGED